MPTSSTKTPARRLPVVPAERAPVGCLTCALCCSYIAVEIDGPSSVKSATEILWHLYHHQVSVYRDTDDEWVVQFETRCRHLLPDNKCGIYETRPHICREYSEQSCEVNAEDEGTTFYTPEAFLTYLQGRSKRIYAAVAKGFMPGPEHLGAVRKLPPAPKRSFQQRVHELRARGLPK
ncbi:MAG: YkgJ family cysteine cluster protein [Myxococcales bacterium]